MNGMTRDREAPALAAEVSGVLVKLESARRALKGYRIWLGLTSLLLAELAVAVAFVVADWLWVLPAAVRGLGLVAMAMLAVIPISRALRRYGRARAAVEIEAHFPELGQRLRTVVDCAAPGEGSVPASPGLIRALGRDTDRRTAGLDFRALVPLRRAGSAPGCPGVRPGIRRHRAARISWSPDGRAEDAARTGSLYDPGRQARRRDPQGG